MELSKLKYPKLFFWAAIFYIFLMNFLFFSIINDIAYNIKVYGTNIEINLRSVFAFPQAYRFFFFISLPFIYLTIFVYTFALENNINIFYIKAIKNQTLKELISTSFFTISSSIIFFFILSFFLQSKIKFHITTLYVLIAIFGIASFTLALNKLVGFKNFLIIFLFYKLAEIFLSLKINLLSQVNIYPFTFTGNFEALVGFPRFKDILTHEFIQQLGLIEIDEIKKPIFSVLFLILYWTIIYIKNKKMRDRGFEPLTSTLSR